MRTFCKAALACAAVLSAPTAHAEPQPMDIAADASWVHEETGITAPPAIADMKRFRATSFAADGSNNGFTYVSDDEGELFSLYVYRAGTTDVAMWGDAAMMAIAGNAKYDGLDYGQALVSFFGDEEIGVDSGIRFAMPVGGDFKATGLALYALGDWLVKARYSSAALGPQALDARLSQLVAQIPHAAPARRAPAAYRIEQCGTAMKAKKAKRVRLDLAQMLIQATAYSAAFDKSVQEQASGTAPESRPRLCRDALESAGSRLVYRPVDAASDYRVALGDSGISISVARGVLSDKDVYWASLSNGSAVELYRPFAGLPAVEQAMDVVAREDPVAAVKRTPEGGSDLSILATE